MSHQTSDSITWGTWMDIQCPRFLPLLLRARSARPRAGVCRGRIPHVVPFTPPGRTVVVVVVSVIWLNPRMKRIVSIHVTRSRPPFELHVLFSAIPGSGTVDFVLNAIKGGPYYLGNKFTYNLEKILFSWLSIIKI